MKELTVDVIASRIYEIRHFRVMIDRDLASLYDVETRVLKQAVRRNIDRFPDDFMFAMTGEEFEKWRSQIVMSKSDKMGLRHAPMVFTEQGVAMLSSVLNSERAIQVNIQIMRTFSKLRQMLLDHADLKKKLDSMEKKYDEQFRIVFEAIRELLIQEEKPKRKIGFREK